MATFGSGNSKRDRILALIALFRLAKALLLILAGFGVLHLLRPDVAERFIEWMQACVLLVLSNIAIVIYLIAVLTRKHRFRGITR